MIVFMIPAIAAIIVEGVVLAQMLYLKRVLDDEDEQIQKRY